jgi:hypothetical protein
MSQSWCCGQHPRSKVHWTDQVAPLGAGRAQAVAAERVTSGISQPQLVQRQAGHAVGAAGEQAYGEGRRVARAVGQDDLTVEPAGRPILPAPLVRPPLTKLTSNGSAVLAGPTLPRSRRPGEGFSRWSRVFQATAANCRCRGAPSARGLNPRGATIQRRARSSHQRCDPLLLMAGLAWLTGGWQRLARSSTCGAPACRRIVLITRPFVILRMASRPIGLTAQSWARRLTTILPAPTPAEAIETTRIQRVAGLTGARTAVVTTRPCRAPHHPISDVGRIGGGQVPMPGEVALAHHGVRFLDERPECRRHGLAALRQPLEEGITRIQFRGHDRSGSAGHTTPYTSCRSRLAPQFSLP